MMILVPHKIKETHLFTFLPRVVTAVVEFVEYVYEYV